MIKQIILSAFLLFVFIIFNSCDSATEVTENPSFDNSYTPLKVGIETQFFYYSDSTYLNNKISGKAIREDGQEVFIETHAKSNGSGINYSYSFIKNGYFYKTSLIKTVYEENPFGEIRIAKPYPQDGDSWYFSEASDSEPILYTAHFIGEMVTPAGVFEDVYSFQYKFKFFPDTVKVYYAKGIGCIGSSSHQGLVLVNYVKTADKEYGKQVPYPKR